MKSIQNNAFTLIELIIVLVIIGIIATYAGVEYKNTLDRADEKSAALSLQAIQLGFEKYNIDNGQYPTALLPNLSTINSTLGLGIVASNFTYACTINTATTYDCYAAKINSWGLHTFKEDSPPKTCIPHCADSSECPPCVGNCPTCDSTCTGCAHLL